MTINQVNHLNTGLMIGSLIAAFVLPFELFLLSYAILGPLHYLTEMSWLHDRDYFMPKRWMAIPIGVLTLTALFSSGYIPKAATAFLPSWLQPEALTSWNAEAVLLALCLALVFVLAKTTRGRNVGLCLVAVGSIAAHYINFEVRHRMGVDAAAAFFPVTKYDVFFTVFLTTIVHVFVFTGAFVLLGALKSKSRSGMISFVVFLLCAVACFVVPVDAIPVLSADTTMGYDTASKFLAAMMLFYGTGEPLKSLDDAYTTSGGVMVARLIAFAYTYHYLNWFSKTSVIKWHAVPKPRLVAVAVIWIVSLALYGMDYLLGLKWLLLLSMLHVFLEFPLNWHSLFGIKQELVKRLDVT